MPHGRNWELSDRTSPLPVFILYNTHLAEIPLQPADDRPALDQLAAQIRLLGKNIACINHVLLSLGFSRKLITEGSIPIRDLRRTSEIRGHVQLVICSLTQDRTKPGAHLHFFVSPHIPRGFIFVDHQGNRYRP